MFILNNLNEGRNIKKYDDLIKYFKKKEFMLFLFNILNLENDEKKILKTFYKYCL